MADRCFESTVVKALEHTRVKRHQTIDFPRDAPGFPKRLLAQHAFDAYACLCGGPGKLLQRSASKVDALLKTFARQASKKAMDAARLREGWWLAMIGQQRGDAHVDLDASFGSFLLEASLLQPVRWLHIASHSFSPWQSGFSEKDAQGTGGRACQLAW